VVEQVLCLDTSVIIKYLTLEEPVEEAEQAIELIHTAQSDTVQLVAPAFAWAEVGSVLRKKVRTNKLTVSEADSLWQFFATLPIDYIDSQQLRNRAWEIAHIYQLPTLYDAAFLASLEVALAPESATREFWTADRVLLNSLGSARPAYVKELGN